LELRSIGDEKIGREPSPDNADPESFEKSPGERKNARKQR